MLFLLRCAFWLTVVYASILLPKSEWHRLTDGTIRAGGAALAQAEHQALAGAMDYCGREASTCLTQAARLTALIDKTAVHDDTPGTTAAADADSGAIPVPVPRPDDVGGAKPTHKR